MNTLNRFTESLVAVNTFRTMWAEEDQSTQGKLLETLAETAAKAKHSPAAGEDGDEGRNLVEDVQKWVRACRDGTVFCVRGLVSAMQSVLEAVSSFFKSSGKENVPRTEF